MAATVEIDKDGDSIVFTEDGVEKCLTVRREDCIISVLPTVAGTTYKKVNQLLYNETTGKLVVIYEA